MRSLLGAVGKGFESSDGAPRSGPEPGRATPAAAVDAAIEDAGVVAAAATEEVEDDKEEFACAALEREEAAADAMVDAAVVDDLLGTTGDEPPSIELERLLATGISIHQSHQPNPQDATVRRPSCHHRSRAPIS